MHDCIELYINVIHSYCIYIYIVVCTRTLPSSPSSVTGEVGNGIEAVPENSKGLTSREMLKQSAEELVSDINAKRKRDVAMMEGVLTSYGLPFRDHVKRPWFDVEPLFSHGLLWGGVFVEVHSN